MLNSTNHIFESWFEKKSHIQIGTQIRELQNISRLNERKYVAILVDKVRKFL